MELRTGPGGNQEEIAVRLRQSLLDVANTERQIQTEIDRLTAQRASLVEGSARAAASGDEQLAGRTNDALAQLDARLTDLRDQLGSAAQARAEIAAQVRGLPRLAASAEAEANIAAVRQMLAAGGIEDVDQDNPDPLAELPKVSVDAELEAIRRELGLAPPPPAEPPPTPEPTPAPESPTPTPAAELPAPESPDQPAPSSQPNQPKTSE